MTSIATRAAALLAGLALALPTAADDYAFQLHGGHFYGPGPVVPDTPLPDGLIQGIQFDLDKLAGVAVYAPSADTLSDGETHTNANIQAGELSIGGDSDHKAFWLYAVAGGPNEGRETYRFDDDHNMVWTVDLALDPGFPEGIVRVDNFTLTTGQRTVPLSLQTEQGMPGGYDKAGSLESGTVLVGRVGDFDADGFLDGVIVASANVPMQADLLPGAPVGNVRGFSSDIPVAPLFALELTLDGIVNLRPLVEQSLTGDQIDTLTERLTDVNDRLLAARANYEAAYLGAPTEGRAALQALGWRLESIRQMIYIPLAFLTTYDYPDGNASSSIVDAVTRAFDKAAALADLLAARRTGGEP